MNMLAIKLKIKLNTLPMTCDVFVQYLVVCNSDYCSMYRSVRSNCKHRYKFFTGGWWTS